MKNKFFYFLAISLCLVVFASCSDDEDTSIQFYASSEKVNSVEVTTIGEISVEVRNANGAYTVKSNNAELATAELNEHSVISIKGIKEGSTTITVTDSENRSATLKVEVTIQKLSMLIAKHETWVQAENATAEDQAAIDKIKTEIISKLPAVGGGFKLLYTSVYAGNLIYYPDTKKLTEKVDGIFTWDGDEASGKRFLKLYYNDTEYIYTFGTEGDIAGRMSPPAQLYLIHNFTESYSQMTKPKITRAVGALLITDGNGF